MAMVPGWREAILCAATGLIVFVGIRVALGVVLHGQLAFYATTGLFALAAVSLLMRVTRGRAP